MTEIFQIKFPKGWIENIKKKLHVHVRHHTELTSWSMDFWLKKMGGGNFICSIIIRFVLGIFFNGGGGGEGGIVNQKMFPAFSS